MLAEGWYDDEEFHVLALGFPPAESNDITRKYFGNTNFFGGPSETTVKAGLYKVPYPPALGGEFINYQVP